jgi:hypothetical protein
VWLETPAEITSGEVVGLASIGGDCVARAPKEDERAISIY